MKEIFKIKLLSCVCEFFNTGKRHGYANPEDNHRKSDWIKRD